MKAHVLALSVVGAVLFSTFAVSESGDKQRDGTWVAIAMEQDGVKLKDGAVKKLRIKLIMTGDTYKVLFGNKVAEQGTSKADFAKKPATVDIDASEGPN